MAMPLYAALGLNHPPWPGPGFAETLTLVNYGLSVPDLFAQLAILIAQVEQTDAYRAFAPFPSRDATVVEVQAFFERKTQ